MKMRDELFRQEAIDHQRLKVHGSIILGQTRFLTMLVFLCSISFCAVLVVFFFCGFARQETWSGTLALEKARQGTESVSLEAVLLAPSSSLSQIQDGLPIQVQILLPADQRAIRIPGIVREISPHPVPKQDLASANADQPLTPMHRIFVHLNFAELSQPDLTLASIAGLHAIATVKLEHRRFYQWALDPLVGMKEQAQ